MTVTLVTGASGFVGGHLTRALVERGHEVRCSVRRTSCTEDLRKLNVKLVDGDLLNEQAILDAVSGVDLVFHSAGCISAFDRSTLLQVNGHGTANVASACARQPEPPTLILVSSIAAAGPTRRGSVRTEHDRPRPVSDYGCSKRAGEIAAEHFANRVPTTIIRPGIVYGPGDLDSVLPMCRLIDRFGIFVIAGMQSPPLSLIHVSQLVDLLIRAAEQGQRIARSDRSNQKAQGYYFAVVPEYPTYFQFGRMLNKALGRTRRTRYLHVPTPYPWLVAAASECIARLRRVPNRFNIDKVREAVVESWACSGKSAERDLGFQAHGSLADQLRDTIQWYRDHDRL